jgi:hypothetical protein
MSPELRECIDNCFRCHEICIETAGHCLRMGGAHAGADHQRILSDCAQACLTSAHFMLHRSNFHNRYCGLCADVCKACADSCEALAQGDQLMNKCIQACRTCEASCRRMAQSA